MRFPHPNPAIPSVASALSVVSALSALSVVSALSALSVVLSCSDTLSCSGIASAARAAAAALVGRPCLRGGAGGLSLPRVRLQVKQAYRRLTAGQSSHDSEDAYFLCECLVHFRGT